MASGKIRTIAIVGTLDTKGEDVKYVKDLIEKRGHRTLVVDSGVLGEPLFKADVTRDRVAQAGGKNLSELVAQRDTDTAVRAMISGAVEIIKKLYHEGRVDAVMSLGGGKGTAIGTAAMRALPFGVPKIAVTTVASGDTSGYVGSKDIVMFPSITDIAGLNRINSRMYANAVGAIIGMVETEAEEISKERAIVGITALGVTTPAAMKCKSRLERRRERGGYAAMIFHTTGVGGRAMEELIDGGVIAGVIDLTTTEMISELVGGNTSSGPDRLEAAGRKSIPQVICPGGLDMVAFVGGRRAIPVKYRDRLFYDHTPEVTLMRTTVEENIKLAEIMAEKVNRSKGPVAILMPTKGFSAYDQEGNVFFDPEADQCFIKTLKKAVQEKISVILIDCHINDDEFAEKAVNLFLEMT